MVLTRGGPTGDTIVFGQSLVLNPSELDAVNRLYPNDTPGYYNWAHAHGGVDPRSSGVQLVLTGNRNHQVRVLSMEVMAECKPPLSGTIFFSPPAGNDPIIKIGFNLDLPHPLAQRYLEGSLAGDYFADNTISLQPDEQQTVEVVGVTARQFCQYSFRMKVLDGKQTVTETIDNFGKPFEVTALLSFSSYQVAYAGGVASPRQITSPGAPGRNDFVQVPPDTLR